VHHARFAIMIVFQVSLLHANAARWQRARKRHAITGAIAIGRSTGDAAPSWF